MKEHYDILLLIVNKKLHNFNAVLIDRTAFFNYIYLCKNKTRGNKMANEIDAIKLNAIARLNQYKKSTMTVQELYDKLGEFIKNGDGDSMIDVADGSGGSYSLDKTTNIFISHTNEETNGKWCYIGE